MTSPSRPGRHGGTAPRPRRHTALRIAACAVLTLVSICCTLGFLLVVHLELSGGFGAPAHAHPQRGYIAFLAGGAVLSVLVPAWACRCLLGPRPPR